MTRRRRRWWADPVLWCAAGAVAATVHAAVNVRLLRRPPDHPAPVGRRVSVLLPLRDEAERVEPCLRALLAQTGVDTLEIVVLDDRSSDGTAALVRRVAGADPRVRLVAGVDPPVGWLGKPHACHQLARHAHPDADVLVFVDADVVLAPHAVAAAVGQLDESGLDLVSPYPRQVTVTPAERLVQPLLQWSWLTFLPLRVAETSPRPSLTAANGQLLAVRRIAYEKPGGHAAVRSEVIEDVALLRAVKATGGTGGVTDGTPLGSCRMYASWPELRDGYAKSLWSA
ncbi:MAG TPA: glycosyltransferase, partial [Cryptosporangiaceae bacterium]|nr:glycosyltransferase [Cryptosporangiaceae bacterium]